MTLFQIGEILGAVITVLVVVLLGGGAVLAILFAIEWITRRDTP